MPGSRTRSPSWRSSAWALVDHFEATPLGRSRARADGARRSLFQGGCTERGIRARVDRVARGKTARPCSGRFADRRQAWLAADPPRRARAFGTTSRILRRGDLGRSPPALCGAPDRARRFGRRVARAWGPGQPARVAGPGLRGPLSRWPASAHAPRWSSRRWIERLGDTIPASLTTRSSGSQHPASRWSSGRHRLGRGGHRASVRGLVNTFRGLVDRWGFEAGAPDLLALRDAYLEPCRPSRRSHA